LKKSVLINWIRENSLEVAIYILEGEKAYID